MKPFEYAKPGTLREAIGELGAQWGERAVLAGGTDLLALMKDNIETPSRLVDIKGLGELAGIKHSSDGLRLGATATIDDLLADRAIAANYSALRQAADGITSPQIRNRGTVGGDLCQRPRCWFYRLGYGLLAADGEQSLAAGGDNRYHAIFGNSGPAKFVNPSSLAPALAAMEAEAVIEGPSGSRIVKIAEFFRAPAAAGERENVLAANEILTEVRVPRVPGTNATYEVRQRMLLDWPLATASVVLGMEGGTVRSARVLLGHVAPTPWRSEAAERAITGQAVSEETASAAGDAAAGAATPLSRNRYKVQLTRVAVKRAILAAARASSERG